MKIGEIKWRVATILEAIPEARNSDKVLYGKLLEIFYEIGEKDGFLDILYNRKDLPSYESVTRVRRKLQERMPLVYGASGKVRKMRAELENEYREEFGEKY